MATLVLDSYVEDRIREERRISGADRFDEVWDGVYVMSPLANNEHQGLAAGLSAIFQIVLNWGQFGEVFAGVNVTDQEEDWTRNYRCPDVAVYLNGTTARDRGTHWLGGPDFAVEVASKGDRSREKFAFYAKVNTRELLLIDRDPWALELYRLSDGALSLVGSSRPGDADLIRSEVLPLDFRLVSAEPRPRVEVSRRDGGEPWRF
jgi:Uma2 family endonuclease